MPNSINQSDIASREQYQINCDLLTPFRMLAEGGKVQIPREPHIHQPADQNHENSATLGQDQGDAAHSQHWENHPLLMNDPSFCSPDANNSALTNIVPPDILEQVQEGNGSRPAAQLTLALADRLQAQKKSQLGLSYSTPRPSR